MKKQKRDGEVRAFNHGYQAAVSGKSLDHCPHESEPKRYQWVTGWREGRQDQWSGVSATSILHR